MPGLATSLQSLVSLPKSIAGLGAPAQGGGVDLTFAFTFNGEPFTMRDVAFTYGAP